MSRSFLLAPCLDPPSRAFWDKANRNVLWGWKRDEGNHSRVVYFSAELQKPRNGIVAANSFFFYKHRTTRPDAEFLRDQLQAALPSVSSTVGECTLSLRPSGLPNYDWVEFSAGVPGEADKDRVRRLQMRKPRRSLGNTDKFEANATLRQAIPLFPADLYLGSGVSYEAGLPTLCQVHDFFCLDDRENFCFTHGKRDLLPLWLKERTTETFRTFCHLHVKALTVQPTAAQRVVKELFEAGQVMTVFTDNVDNLLCKVGVPFVRTRGSGVFNERFPATFTARTLIVVGVAADRREIVRQARGQRKKIVIVNPCSGVSLGVQHLNYIKPRDFFLKLTAHEFFTAVKELLF